MRKRGDGGSKDEVEETGNEEQGVDYQSEDTGEEKGENEEENGVEAEVLTNPKLALASQSNDNLMEEGSVNTRVAQCIAMNVLNLSAEQAMQLRYFVRCPVRYNFSELTGTCLNIREGVVLSAHLDILTMTLSFKIERKSKSGPFLIDTICDDDISFSPNCPIVFSFMGTTTPSVKLHGLVIHPKPVRNEMGRRTMSYTVSFFSGRDHFVSVEEGVTSDLLKYLSPSKGSC
jgi:hypothetical protein